MSDFGSQWMWANSLITPEWPRSILIVPRRECWVRPWTYYWRAASLTEMFMAWQGSVVDVDGTTMLLFQKKRKQLLSIFRLPFVRELYHEPSRGWKINLYVRRFIHGVKTFQWRKTTNKQDNKESPNTIGQQENKRSKTKANFNTEGNPVRRPV